GLTDKTAEINRCAAAISREAAGPDRHVIASIGPTGKFLMTGEVTEQELYEAFAEQASALEAGGADACCIETMMAPDEAAIAARAARENTRLEVLCTFTFDHPVNGVHRTMMGSSPQEVAAAALEAGAHIVGSNCGYGPAEMVEVVRALRAAAPGVPILVQPNAGLPETGPDGLHYPETPESMAGYVGRLLEAGANILGGCCGTTPAHIRLIKDAADRAVP
ncbi:MAG: homocysteine S-methyltransferase family protein, partial [Candidatus Hydrogenedentes bacterium]|nr:homocysteine S-methyltransferase family protein [Candidatus Hydrogenedentota bacterium]